MTASSFDHRIEDVARAIVDHGFQLHKAIGPGLLETAYEAFLCASLREAGLEVDQQLSLPATYGRMTIDNAFRIDLLVEKCVIVELKSTERLLPVHSKQVLTYLRLMQLAVGLLINFGTELFRDGVKRIVDSHSNYQAPK